MLRIDEDLASKAMIGSKAITEILTQIQQQIFYNLHVLKLILYLSIFITR